MNTKDFQEEKEKMEDIAYNYFLAKKIISSDKDDKKTNDKDNEFYCDYVNKVAASFDSLDLLERDIINNEFFFQNYDGWWKKTYTKTAFDNIKKIAIRHFLEDFYHE